MFETPPAPFPSLDRMERRAALTNTQMRSQKNLSESIQFMILYPVQHSKGLPVVPSLLWPLRSLSPLKAHQLRHCHLITSTHLHRSQTASTAGIGRRALEWCVEESFSVLQLPALGPRHVVFCYGSYTCRELQQTGSFSPTTLSRMRSKDLWTTKLQTRSTQPSASSQRH